MGAAHPVESSGTVSSSVLFSFTSVTILTYAWTAVAGVSKLWDALGWSRVVFQSSPEIRSLLEGVLSEPFKWGFGDDYVSWISTRLLPTTLMLVLVIVSGVSTRLLGIRNWFNPEQYIFSSRWVRAALATVFFSFMLVIEQSAFSLPGSFSTESHCGNVGAISACRSQKTLSQMSEFAHGQCRINGGILGRVVSNSNVDSLCVLADGSPAQEEFVSNMNSASWAILSVFILAAVLVVAFFQREMYAAFAAVVLVMFLGFVDLSFGITSFMQSGNFLWKV